MKPRRNIAFLVSAIIFAWLFIGFPQIADVQDAKAETYSIPASLVNPGWSYHRKRVVFYNGNRFFLLYSKGGSDANIYYQSSKDNVTWSGESTLNGIGSSSVFDIYLVNDTKFDLVYRISSNYHRVVTCTISGATITAGSPSANWLTAVASTELVVARSGTGDRIYVATGAGDRLRIYSADQTGDAQNVTSWTEEHNGKDSPEDIAMVPYQGSDQVLLICSEFKFDRVYAYVVTRGSGAANTQCFDYASTPDISSPVSLSDLDNDFRFIILQPSGAMEEWKWDGSSCTQVDANIDPEGETDHSSPSLFYDRISGDMYAFSMDSNVERHYKPSGGSWQTEEDVDGDVGIGFYSNPITQMHDPPYGSSRTWSALVWAFRVESGTEYNLKVGTLTFAPRISSDANQVFAVGQAATTASQITITEADTPSITAANDLRIRIADGVDMVWDTSASPTYGGTYPGNVTLTSYEDNDRVLVIDVDTDFAAGETLIINDAAFKTFGSVNSPVSGLQLLRDGPSDTSVDGADDKTIAIGGAVTLADHTAGQVGDKFAGQTESETTTEYFQFQLDNDGESASTTLTVDLSSISGIFTGDVTNAKLWADVTGDGSISPPGGWTTYDKTGETDLFALAFDSTNNVLYAGGTSGNILRCDTTINGGCDDDTDWSVSYATGESQIRSLLFDYERNVIYAGSNGTGYIYRCDTSTGCDEAADWTTAYDPNGSSIYSFTLDQTNNVIYAVGSGSSDNIVRCDTASGCDEDADWSRAYGTGLTFYSVTFDSTNNVVYAGNLSGYIYRCDPNLNTCINGDGWTSYDTMESAVRSLTFDATNDVLYAGTGSAGVIYRCDTSTGCDAFNDWTTSYDTPETYIWSFTFDSNNILYAGTGSGDNIYSCDTSTGCDEAGDWTSSYAAGGDVRALTFDSANNVIYGGNGLGDIVRKFNGDYRVFQGEEVNWTTSYDTPESTIGSLTFDSTNEIMYAGATNGIIYRCDSSTGCYEATDWTTSYDTTENEIRSLTFDSGNNVIYAGSDGDGIIYRCDTSTPGSCDDSTDWTTSYNSPTRTAIYSLAFDSFNEVIYAGTIGGDILRCDTSTGCDAQGDWTTSVAIGQPEVAVILFDPANNVLYAGARIIYRCDTSTGCDAGGDWTLSLDNISSFVHALTLDSTNNVIYAGADDGIIYRCDTSTLCNASGDWTTSYNTGETDIDSLTFDSLNNALYAGSEGGGIIYRCDAATGCDASTDWTTSYDTTEGRIPSLTFDSTHGVVYAGSSTSGIIFRGDTSDGVVDISGATGTITFSDSTLPAGTMDYLLRATIINIADGDTITFDLSPSGVVATGEVSGVSLSVSDSSTDPLTSITHTRGSALKSFGFRKSITIDRTKIPGTCGTTLSNYPMLFSVTDGDLKTTTYGGDVASYDAPSNDPRDIIFRALDDDTCSPGTAPCGLYHEIEDYDETTGELVAWVKIPSVNTNAASSDTVIYIYYGNSDVPSSTQNANAVWDNNYVGVWHLAESSGDALDSTFYGSNGSVTGTFTRQATGQIGDAYDFSTNGEVDVGDPVDGHLDFGTGSYTVSAWMNVDQSTGTWQRYIYKGGSSAGERGYVFETDQTASTISAGISDGANNYYNGASISLDTWTHIVQVCDRSAQELRIYKNGAEQGTATDINGVGSVSNSYSLQFPHAGSYDADGLLDEVRISKIDRSDCWIGAEYNNQAWPDKAVTPTPDPSPNPDSGFYTLGGEEPTPATAVSLASFTAKGEGSSVLVEWETAQELNHMGFHLYRARSPWGPFTRLTDKLISGLTSSVVGREYFFEDKDVTPGEIYYYRLEDIDIYGKKTLHGPICVDWDGDGLPDDWEIAHGLNPGFDDASLDSDSDGLTNWEEYLRGTDPFNPDTDGDGILDGEDRERDTDSQGGVRTLSPGIYILAADETGTTLELRTDSFDFTILEAEGQEYERLKIPEYIHGFTPEVGKPELPLKGILLDIPEGNSATLRVLQTEDELHTGYQVYPVPENSVDDQAQLAHVGEIFVLDEAAYSVDSFYPETVARLGEQYLFRGQQKQQIVFSPLTFNPTTGEIRHYRRIRVRVDYAVGEWARARGPEPTVWSPSGANDGSKDLSSFVQMAFLTPSMFVNPIASVLSSAAILTRAIWAPPSAATPAYKILVVEDGIYRLTEGFLLGGGVDVGSMDLSQVRLYNLGGEVAIHIYDADGDDRLEAGDYIYFYGRAVEEGYAKYTTDNVYWLTLEGGAGAPKRMAAIDGTPASVSVPLTHSFTVHHEEDRKYWAGAPGGDSLDRYFLDPYVIGPDVAYAGAGDPVSFDFTLPGVADQGTLKIMMAGTWAPSHQVAVSLNGTPVGTYSWNDIAFYEATIEGVDLIDGLNTVTLECLSGVDSIAVDWFEVTYPRSFEPYSDTLRFSYETGYLFQVSGFNTDNLMAFDITSPVNVDRVVNFETSGTGPYTLDFEPESGSGERTYLVLTADQVLDPVAIIEDEYGNLADPATGSDYILITHRDVGWDVNGDPHPWLTDLVSLRQGQGLRVKVVDVEDIFDEFSYGIFAPEAIRDFLSYTYTSWTPPAPQYVLLVGDSTRNPKNNPDPTYGLDTVTTYIPTYLAFTEHMGETATDEWFVRVSGDDELSDFYLGRLPAKSADEATAMVNKILAYEGNLNTKSWEKNVLLLADDQRDGPEYEYEANFEIMNDDVAALLPAAMNDPVKGYLSDYFDADVLSAEIIAQINSGTLMVNYSGHSSVQILANHKVNYENIFNNSDVDTLTNSGMYPLFIGMGCLSGHFVYPENWNWTSLAEALLRAEDKGAAAALMSTGLTTTEGQHILDTALFDAIFNQDVRVLGQAVSSAKQTLMANGGSTYEEVNDTFLLFGDPAMLLKVPLPQRPEGLRAQGNGSAVDLSWDEATDCNGGAVSGYNLYRSTTPGGIYTQVNTALITDNQYDDISVAAGTTYYYVVTSVDADDDESAQSQEASGGTQNANSEGSGGGGGGCFINAVAEK